MNLTDRVRIGDKIIVLVYTRESDREVDSGRDYMSTNVDKFFDSDDLQYFNENCQYFKRGRYVLGDKMPDLTEDNHGALILTWGNKEIDNGLDLSKLFDDINASIYRWRCLRDGKKPDNLQYYGINERTTFFDFEVIGWGKMFQRKDENDENKQKDGIIFL